MKTADIHVGSIVWTKVGEERVQVRVVGDLGGRGARYRVQRVDNGTYLPKTRSAAALHASGTGYWAGMTESPEVEGRPARTTTKSKKTVIHIGEGFAIKKTDEDRVFPWRIFDNGRPGEQARSESEARRRAQEFARARRLSRGRKKSILSIKKKAREDRFTGGLFSGARKSRKYGGPLLSESHRSRKEQDLWQRGYFDEDATLKELRERASDLASMPANERLTRKQMRAIHGRDPERGINYEDYRARKNAKLPLFMVRFLPYADAPVSLTGPRKGYGYGSVEEIFTTLAKAESRVSKLKRSGWVENLELIEAIYPKTGGSAQRLLDEWNDGVREHGSGERDPNGYVVVRRSEWSKDEKKVAGPFSKREAKREAKYWNIEARKAFKEGRIMYDVPEYDVKREGAKSRDPIRLPSAKKALAALVEWVVHSGERYESKNPYTIGVVKIAVAVLEQKKRPSTKIELALAKLTSYITSGRRYISQNPYTVPEIKGAYEALGIDWRK